MAPKQMAPKQMAPKQMAPKQMDPKQMDRTRKQTPQPPNEVSAADGSGENAQASE